jgi:signal transduction histidine kinase
VKGGSGRPRAPRSGKRVQWTRFAEIGEDLAAGDGSPEQLERALARGGAALGYDAVLHYEPLEAGAARLTLVAAAGMDSPLPEQLREIAGAEHVFAAAVRRERAILERLDTSPPAAALCLHECGIRCCVCEPLVIGADLLGVLVFARRTQATVRPSDLELIEWFGSLVARHIARRRGERPLSGLREDLRGVSRREDDFLAILAHEVRNPLAPIRSAVQGLKAAAPDNAAICTASDIIERQVTYLVRLVDDLLDVARLGRGKLALKNERIELMAVVRQAVEACRPQLAAARHELVVTSLDDSCCVTGDFVRLTQVVSNLIANAAKFTPPGGRIETIIGREGGSAVLRVRDNGRGMDAATVANVFEMFYQGPRAGERSRGGLGIGLALVRSIVALHRGEVEAFSSGPGYGSEFVVRLPLAGESAPADAPTRPLERKDARRESSSRPAKSTVLKAG